MVEQYTEAWIMFASFDSKLSYDDGLLFCCWFENKLRVLIYT